MSFLRIRINNRLKREQNNQLINELFEVEDFLILLSKNLLNNISAELAFRLAVNQFNGNLKPIFHNAVEEILTGSLCLKDVVEKIINMLKNPQSKQLFKYLMDLIDYDSKKRASVVIKTLYRLKENQQLYYKRQNVLKAQQFKIKFLVTIISIVLGMICSLSPWFSLAAPLLNTDYIINPFTIQFELQQSPYVFATFLIISLLNAYTLYNTVKLEHKIIFILIAPILFTAAYMTGNIIISAILKSWV